MERKIKVVYNACYGGFALSNKAITLLGYASKMDFKFSGDPLARHDPRLVEVVEKLGKEASTPYSNLQIAEIKGNKYRISEYDGFESVMEPEDYEWVIV